MKATQFTKFQKQLAAGTGAICSHHTGRRACGRRASRLEGPIRGHRQQCALAETQARIHRIAAYVLTAVVILAAVAAHAQPYDPPIAPLVTNMLQPPGPDGIATLDGQRDGLYQAFKTGPNPGGYELQSIWLYVRNAHESRHMTIDAGLYRGVPPDADRIATLTRRTLKDFSHNRWRAPGNTFLEPNTTYVFVLDCTAGCEHGRVAEIGTTRSSREDPGSEHGWSVEDHLGFRSSHTGDWSSDYRWVFRMRVKGRLSPFRAYKAQIISRPSFGDTYRHGENIDVALTFNTAVYVRGSDSTIAIQVGDGDVEMKSRTAHYLFGSGTCLLVYRYQVSMNDTDTNGVSLGLNEANTAFGASVPVVITRLGWLPVRQHYPSVFDNPRHKVDGSFHVSNVEIISRPEEDDIYRPDEDIVIALTFSMAAYARPDSVIALRVGDATDGVSYRAAGYLSGSGTKRLLYRYRVHLSDFDESGIAVNGSGPNSGFGGPLPTASADFGFVESPRHFPNVGNAVGHRVGRSVYLPTGADSSSMSKDGA